MKKLALISIMLISVTCFSGFSQGNLLKKAANKIGDELTGAKEAPVKNQPEPACACDNAEEILVLGDKYKINYTEMSVSVKDDGSILIKDMASGDYYIVKGKTTTGPIKEGDPRIAEFEINDSEEGQSLLTTYKEYIKKSGEKYTITFGDKKYGPYASISSFAVTRSKDKFVATVTENLIASENQAQKMEEAIKNAKTDQERMDLAMQFSQSMANSMMQSGGPASLTPKVISNIPDIKVDPMQGGTFNSKMKYDDIVMARYDGVTDLAGNKLIAIKPEHAGAEEIFINSSNTKYAINDYGTLTFSDNSTLTELFNPHLVKVDGKVFLAYMYYSPKKNAIMQCRIPF